MTEQKLAKINFIVSAVCFVAVLFIITLSMSVAMPIAFMFAFFGGISVGSAISFFGLGFVKTSRKSFMTLFLVQVIIYFLMNIVAAVKVSVLDDGITKFSFAGIAEVIALVSLAAITIFALAIKKPLDKKFNTALFCVVSATYLFLIVYVLFSHKGMSVYNVICEILQYLQIVSAAGFMAFICREKRNDQIETV